MNKIKNIKIGIGFIIILIMNACTFYNFKGNTLHEDVKTIQIRDFVNSAALVNPTLAQQFSIDMNTRFLTRTTLKGTTEKPDILIEGEITNYEISPVAVTSPTTSASTGATLQSAQTRLTISVRVHYENAVEPEKGFDRTYTDEVTFSSDMDTNTIEASQVRIVNERIINKIFNDIIADW
ncbi:MAG: LPS assembly lipoprotein LptE [Bergeyella zoohelcum]|nr:LPS assembly lipoprotein LptE [Bergeyella zoohelcum]